MGFILLSLTWIQQQCFRWVQVRDLFHVLEVMTEAHPPYRLFERWRWNYWERRWRWEPITQQCYCLLLNDPGWRQTLIVKLYPHDLVYSKARLDQFRHAGASYITWVVLSHACCWSTDFIHVHMPRWLIADGCSLWHHNTCWSQVNNSLAFRLHTSIFCVTRSGVKRTSEQLLVGKPYLIPLKICLIDWADESYYFQPQF